MSEFTMRYRCGEINAERARMLAFALREIAAGRSPIAYFEIERRVRRALKVPGDEPLNDLAGALFLLARAGVDTAKVNWQAAPRQIWEQTMALVTDAELAKIVTVAVADPSVARYHAKLRAAMA